MRGVHALLKCSDGESPRLAAIFAIDQGCAYRLNLRAALLIG